MVTAFGVAIIIESSVLVSLGLLLLFFSCKCAVHLVRERRRHKYSPLPNSIPKETDVSMHFEVLYVSLLF